MHGLMLPGLGADIENLDKRTFRDWLEALTQAVEKLRQEHSVIILVGYSMGGALALHATLDQHPAGLVLLAPFWRLAEGWPALLWPVVRLFFRRVKPLKHADFSAIDVRHGLQRMFKNIDLENPQTQLALRQLTASLSPSSKSVDWDSAHLNGPRRSMYQRWSFRVAKIGSFLPHIPRV